MSRALRHGWSSDWRAMQNTPAIEEVTLHKIVGSEFGMGGELDEAFRRGREYHTRGYTRSATLQAYRKKSHEYKEALENGWDWQEARHPRPKKKKVYPKPREPKFIPDDPEDKIDAETADIEIALLRLQKIQSFIDARK